MANIKSQKKRIITNEKSRIINRSFKSKLKTIIKKYQLAVDNQVENVQELKNNAISIIDSSITKGIYHKNKAANLKSKICKYGK